MSSAVLATSQVTRPSATMETICAATIDMVPLFLIVFLMRLLVLAEASGTSGGVGGRLGLQVLVFCWW